MSACGDVTDAHLSGITGRLDISDMGVTALLARNFAGLSRTTEQSLKDNDIETLPEEIFKGLAGLGELSLTFTKLTAVSAKQFNCARGVGRCLLELDRGSESAFPRTLAPFFVEACLREA